MTLRNQERWLNQQRTRRLTRLDLLQIAYVALCFIMVIAVGFRQLFQF